MIKGLLPDLDQATSAFGDMLNRNVVLRTTVKLDVAIGLTISLRVVKHLSLEI